MLPGHHSLVIGADVEPADVVAHDEDDVRLLAGRRSAAFPGGTTAVGAGAAVLGGCMTAAPPLGDPVGAPLGDDACVMDVPEGTDGSIWTGPLLGLADTSPTPSH